MKTESSSVFLRKATISDLPVLQYWDTQTHVIESDPNDDWNWEEELGRDVPWREMLMAEVQGRVIGFIQIIDPLLEETHYWGAVGPNLRAIDIWIGAASDLGKGFGSEMMRQAAQHCFASPDVTGILVDPLSTNIKAHRFYEKLGFRFLEDRVLGDDHCLIYILDRSAFAEENALHL